MTVSRRGLLKPASKLPSRLVNRSFVRLMCVKEVGQRLALQCSGCQEIHDCPTRLKLDLRLN